MQAMNSASAAADEGLESLKITVGKLMKKVLPSHCAVDEEALNMMVKCVIELGSSLSCESINITSANALGPVTGITVVRSLTDLGFDNYVNPVKSYLHHRLEHIQSCQPCSKPDLEAAPPAPPRKKPMVAPAPKDSSEPPAKRGRPAKGTVKASQKTLAEKTEDPSSAPAGKPSGEVVGPGRKRGRKVADWADPRYVEQFVKVMTEAMQSGKANEEIIKEVSKSMRMSIKDVRVRFRALLPTMTLPQQKQPLQQQQMPSSQTPGVPVSSGAAPAAMAAGASSPSAAAAAANPDSASGDHANASSDASAPAALTAIPSLISGAGAGAGAVSSIPSPSAIVSSTPVSNSAVSGNGHSSSSGSINAIGYVPRASPAFPSNMPAGAPLAPVVSRHAPFGGAVGNLANAPRGFVSAPRMSSAMLAGITGMPRPGFPAAIMAVPAPRSLPAAAASAVRGLPGAGVGVGAGVGMGVGMGVGAVAGAGTSVATSTAPVAAAEGAAQPPESSDVHKQS